MKKNVSILLTFIMLVVLVFGCSLGQTDSNAGKKNAEQENVLDQMSIKKAPIASLSGISSVSAGNRHSLALGTDGTVWATGNNSSGQLGRGNYQSSLTWISVFSGAKAISCADSHSLLVDNNGNVWATGYNGYGQLGTGNNQNYNYWRLTTTISNCKAVSAGWYHSMALGNDGKVYVTGYNGSGQLGTGDYNNRNTWVQSGSHCKVISAGYLHSMHLEEDGDVWVAGYNGYGQLGTGNYNNTNQWVKTKRNCFTISTNFSANHSMVLVVDSGFNGIVWVTGNNSWGQLGTGDYNKRNTWIDTFSDAYGFSPKISAGGRHSLAWNISTQISATGSNTSWQAGLSEQKNYNTWGVSTSSFGLGVISSGKTHSLLVTNVGDVYVTGDNSSGQLGTGDKNPRTGWSLY